MERIKGIMVVVKRIQMREKEVSDVMGAAAEEISPADALGGFMDDFDELLGTYADEYEEMRLDEAVVAAISPIVSFSFQFSFSELTWYDVDSASVCCMGSTLGSNIRCRAAQTTTTAFPHRQTTRSIRRSNGCRRVQRLCDVFEWWE